MSTLTRRFTMDKESIYFVNSGIITRKNVLDFIKQYEDAYKILYNSGDNIGYNGAGTALMFTEGDNIVRIDDDVLIAMIKDGDVSTVRSKDPGTFTLRYPESKYPDGEIIIQHGYKMAERNKSEMISIGSVPDINDSPNVVKCVLVQDPYNIYVVDDGRISKGSIINYMAVHGDSWRSELAKSKDYVGYTYDDKAAMLRITKDKIERIDTGAYQQLIKHADTRVCMRTSSFYDYLVVEYDSNIFTDEVLRANAGYK